jgi:hypothetical protein
MEILDLIILNVLRFLMGAGIVITALIVVVLIIQFNYKGTEDLGPK